MVSKRVLASVCMATLLIGTQAVAENTGVDSAVNSTVTATAVIEEDLNTEASQIQLIEQAIRDVEAQLQNEKKHSSKISYKTSKESTRPAKKISTPVLSKVSPSLQYQGQHATAQSQGRVRTVDSRPALYSGGIELSENLPDTPLTFDDNFHFDTVASYEPGFIQEFPNGAVNWLSGVVTARGESFSTGLEVSSRQARLKTVRAATIEARKNLFEILSKIPVTDTLRVRNILRSDEEAMQFIRGDMQNSRVMFSRFTKEGNATVTVSIKLRDMLLEKLISKHVSFHRVSDNPYSAVNAVAESIEKAGSAESNTAMAQPTAYTGLLVDAREVGISPAITVNIVDEKGQVLYSPRVVNRAVALRNGMVEYAGTWEEGIASKRSSSNPLVLKALRAKGKARSNIVISEEQAALLRQINNANKFLEEGRVVVVCN